MNYNQKKIKSTFKINITKCKSQDTQNLTIEQYLQKLRSYLHGMINNFNVSNEKKVQITSKLEFMSSKDANEKCEIYITSSNLENMVGEVQIKSSQNVLILFCIGTRTL